MPIPSPTRSRYDVIVVGAGAGGLTAAAFLARGGRSVLVLAPEPAPGGNLMMFNRGPFRFDVGLHYVGDCGPEGVIPGILQDLGQGEAVHFRPLDPDGFDHYVFPDFTFRCPSSIDTYRERLLELFPQEAGGIDRYVAFIRECGAALPLIFQAEAALFHPPRLRPLAAAGLGLRLLASCPHFLAQLSPGATLSRFLGQLTSDPKLRALLGANHVTYGVAPSEVSPGLHGAVCAHYFGGAWYPRGGGQALADALCRGVEDHGGEVVLRSRVERIRTQGTRVSGVQARIRGEKVVLDADMVVSNADIRQTYEQLIGRENLRSRESLKPSQMKMAMPLFIVYLGLRREGLEDALKNSNVHVLPDYDVDGFYQDIQSGRLPERPHTFISIASTKDPDNPHLAPEGQVNVEIMSLAPPQPQVWGVTAEQVSDTSYRQASAYREIKAMYADRIIDMAERGLPGLRQAIAYQTEATPLTHIRYFHTTGGSAYGIAGIARQFGPFRPGCRTEFNNLFLAGASVRTCHGIDAAIKSGVVAADAILGQRLVERMWRRR